LGFQGSSAPVVALQAASRLRVEPSTEVKLPPQVQGVAQVGDGVDAAVGLAGAGAGVGTVADDRRRRAREQQRHGDGGGGGRE
jgi:hypothetical protein